MTPEQIEIVKAIVEHDRKCARIYRKLADHRKRDGLMGLANCAIGRANKLDTQATALEALLAEREELRVALESLLIFFNNWDESPNDGFERVAAIFLKETGFLMPGKDCLIHDYEVRRQEYSKWHKARIAKARAAMKGDE